MDRIAVVASTAWIAILVGVGAHVYMDSGFPVFNHHKTAALEVLAVTESQLHHLVVGRAPGAAADKLSRREALLYRRRLVGHIDAYAPDVMGVHSSGFSISLSHRQTIPDYSLLVVCFTCFSNRLDDFDMILQN